MAYRPIEHRPMQAPAEDGGVLAQPPLADAVRLLEANRRLLDGHDYDFQGRSLASLRTSARRELVCDARRYTAAYRDVAAAPSGRIILAGHQPQLFHPGVWFKNFALGRLAAEGEALAINLVIDSDTIKTAAIRVPTGSADRPRLATVAMDHATSPIPYEERRVHDRAFFADFGRRVAEAIAPLVPDPLVRRYWPLAVHRAWETDNLGACLAQSRHLLEGQWGVQTLEVPQSRICQSPSFAWLIAHVAAQIDRFAAAYNAAVVEYRRANRIRNAAHPVPELAVDGPWRETPFWVWTTKDPQRRGLWVRSAGRQTLFSNRQGIEWLSPLSAEGDAAAAVEQLIGLADRGIKLRSRALLTTLWARLALGDLFLHGIGGGKYDQVTDAIVQRFFGLAPPAWMVLSATLRLPIARSQASGGDVAALAHRLRQMTWRPEAFATAADAGDVQQWIDRKRRWIAAEPTPANARERFLRIREATAALQSAIADRRQQTEAELAAARRRRQTESLLAWREYAFCLFPESSLRPLFEKAGGLRQAL